MTAKHMSEWNFDWEYTSARCVFSAL